MPHRRLRFVLLVLCLGPSCSQAPPAPANVPAGAAGTGETPSAGGTLPAIPEEHLSSVVAEVNGKPLYRAFYEQSLNFIRSRLPAGQDQSTLERYLNAKFEALDRIVDDELLYQEAVKEGIVATDDEVLREFRRVAEAAGGETRFLSLMRAEHVSQYDAVEGIRRRLTVNKFIETRLQGASLSDADLLNYYNTNLARFTPEAWVKVFEISLLCPQSAPADVVEKTRQRAAKILANIRAGQPFETMARQYSEDSSAAVGGNIGFVKRGASYPEFDAVMFTMQPGEVSEVIRTKDGFHILEVVEKRGGAPKSFESVKEECRKAVMSQRQNDLVQGAASELRRSAKIVTYLE